MSRKQRSTRDSQSAPSDAAGRVSTSAPVASPIDPAPIAPRDLDVPRVGAHFIRRVYDAAGNLVS